ncbi:MAG: DUF692 family protein [Saprospiraceae bacterium]|nr:DUF692 family protein [Saprospiraceae bacterium]
MIKAAISCNLDTHILQTALPLFRTAEVDAIEWSFDTLYKTKNIPDWFVELLRTFSDGKGLIGHGVFFSIFSGEWTEGQQRWLQHLEKVSKHFSFQHITEHFGFMTGADFHKGAPISVPMDNTSLSIGGDRLKRIANACSCPVGLENLAFTYSLEEVKKHGEFLSRLVSTVNGFIILDLHNLYCQMHNFQISFEEIIKLYPLELVREIHISGGSWQESDLAPEKKVRRDTHDQAVPIEVFNMLSKAIPLCPNLKFVVLEAIGTGLKTEKEKEDFQKDYQTMKALLTKSEPNPGIKNFIPDIPYELGEPMSDDEFALQQIELSNILETADNLTTAQASLSNSSLANTSWDIEHWSPHMLEAVIAIAQKWKMGFD